MNTRPERYHAFLLRFWQIEQDGEETWQASLEDSRTGEKRGFASIEALVKYVWELTRRREGVESDKE